MVWTVAILAVVVWYLAKQAPSDPNAANQTSLPPPPVVPATGNNGVPSPAVTYGSPNIAMANSGNELRRRMTYTNVNDSSKLTYNMTSAQSWNQRQRTSSLQPNYLTDADSSLKTQDVAPQTSTVMPDGVSGDTKV